MVSAALWEIAPSARLEKNQECLYSCGASWWLRPVAVQLTGGSGGTYLWLDSATSLRKSLWCWGIAAEGTSPKHSSKGNSTNLRFHFCGTSLKKLQVQPWSIPRNYRTWRRKWRLRYVTYCKGDVKFPRFSFSKILSLQTLCWRTSSKHNWEITYITPVSPCSLKSGPQHSNTFSILTSRREGDFAKPRIGKKQNETKIFFIFWKHVWLLLQGGSTGRDRRQLPDGCLHWGDGSRRPTTLRATDVKTQKCFQVQITHCIFPQFLQNRVRSTQEWDGEKSVAVKTTLGPKGMVWLFLSFPLNIC